MKAVIKSIENILYNGPTVSLTVTLDGSYIDELCETANDISVSNKPYVMSLEKQKRKRSLSANAYLWTLLDKIAARVGSTKETVYRKNIHEVGLTDIVNVKKEAAKRWIRNWSSKGVGWHCEILGEGAPGYYEILVYYGSSVYDTAEMSRLIDSVVQDAKALGIETMTPNELERMKSAWKGD